MDKLRDMMHRNHGHQDNNDGMAPGSRGGAGNIPEVPERTAERLGDEPNVTGGNRAPVGQPHLGHHNDAHLGEGVGGAAAVGGGAGYPDEGAQFGGQQGEGLGKHHHQHQEGHHLGRDAAVAGAVGVGGYEAEKHHRHHEGQHHHGQQEGAEGHQHHLGRDAAGAGAVGVGGYEAEKHHRHHEGHHQGQEGAEGHQHHLGRDAAVAGGVGAVGYEAEKHHRHHKEEHAAGGAGGIGGGAGAGGLGTGMGGAGAGAGAGGAGLLAGAEAGNNFPGTNPHPAHSALGNVSMTGEGGNGFPRPRGLGERLENGLGDAVSYGFGDFSHDSSLSYRHSGG